MIAYIGRRTLSDHTWPWPLLAGSAFMIA